MPLRFQSRVLLIPCKFNALFRSWIGPIKRLPLALYFTCRAWYLKIITSAAHTHTATHTKSIEYESLHIIRMIETETGSRQRANQGMETVESTVLCLAAVGDRLSFFSHLLSRGFWILCRILFHKRPLLRSQTSFVSYLLFVLRVQCSSALSTVQAVRSYGTSRLVKSIKSYLMRGVHKGLFLLAAIVFVVVCAIKRPRDRSHSPRIAVLAAARPGVVPARRI